MAFFGGMGDRGERACFIPTAYTETGNLPPKTTRKVLESFIFKFMSVKVVCNSGGH